MKEYVITYHMGSDPDIIVTVNMPSYEAAVIYAKQYRKDGFSICPDE